VKKKKASHETRHSNDVFLAFNETSFFQSQLFPRESRINNGLVRITPRRFDSAACEP
jgi:hypothetical protein